jgi:DNA-binding PadR family transcriptional regulator
MKPMPWEVPTLLARALWISPLAGVLRWPPRRPVALWLSSVYDNRNSTSGSDIMADDPVTRHFFNGFIRLHILYHAAKEPVYGAEITEELVRHGYRLSQGTLYPTLHQLEELGYLRSSLRVVEGRRRRYYQVTRPGRTVLKQARKQLLELVAEVVEDQDAPFQTMREKRGARAKGRGGRSGQK